MGQPITVAVGPLATAAATGVSAAQAGKAGKPLVFNGASGDAVATAIAAAQAVAGAGNLTLNGTLASSAPSGTAAAYLSSPSNVYVTSAGNDAGITFTIYGTSFDANGIFAQTETITGANVGVSTTLAKFATVTRVAASGAAAGNVSVGKFAVATLDTPRRVIVTPSGDDTGKTFALTGTNASGQIINESLAGTNNTAIQSVLDYKTVTSIIPSAATAGTATAGTNGVASSRWVRFDDYAGMAEVTIQATVTGTANYSVQQTMQDPNDPTSPVLDDQVAWFAHPTSALVAASASQQGYYGTGTLPVPIFARVLLNSGTGSVSTVFRQVYTG